MANLIDEVQKEITAQKLVEEREKIKQMLLLIEKKREELAELEKMLKEKNYSKVDPIKKYYLMGKYYLEENNRTTLTGAGIKVY